jgi:acetyl-CoA carboxylase carboxyl transferase subunit beta
MTHPTTGGVTASFATIGDINLAEPKCMIGFAGPRVVKETTHQNLPPGFQTAEFMLGHGLIDAIVPRAKMREKITELLGYMMPR